VLRTTLLHHSIALDRNERKRRKVEEGFFRFLLFPSLSFVSIEGDRTVEEGSAQHANSMSGNIGQSISARCCYTLLFLYVHVRLAS
jgi:hypothetical protein